MGSRRHLTIGVTVNLENYENLRLEMSAEVEGEKDTEELIASLDAILARLGRGTQETAELVDSYRRRVFTLPKETTPPDKAPEVTPPPVAVIPTSPSPLAEERAPTPLPLPVTSPTSPAAILPPVTSPAPAAVPAAEKSPVPASTPVKPAIPTPPPVSIPPPLPGVSVPPLPSTPRPEVPSPSPPQAPAPPSSPPRLPGELSCERCGAPITTIQRKLSRLFQNKDLCKKCLNQP